MVIAPDIEARRFGYRDRAARATVSSSFRKEWRDLRSKLREKMLDGGCGGQDQADAQQKRRYRQRRLWLPHGGGDRQRLMGFLLACHVVCPQLALAS
ncbi:hypothetical protein, partial [Shinella sp. M27]|uniref:hypothetical protein n=1 Tax=Shinella sp. M27 TaxID=3368614 RepID=UPI003BA101BC